MIINDLFTNKKTKVSEGMAGKVVFSGTGANGGTYEIIQSSPTDFMIHANGKHIDTYGSLQRAMSVLKNEVQGLQQGMAEGKADYNFDIEDLKRLEQIRDLTTLKAQALALISKPSARPMKPEKVEWFRNALARMDSPLKIIKLMYDLLLSGEGKAVVGTRSSMNPNIYHKRFGEQGMAENQDWMKDLAARAAAKSKPGTPYVPPKQDAEKARRDLTARYPNIDELVAAAEKRRDPDYEYAEGPAYYQGREAERNYLRLKQIQRVIQGLNEAAVKQAGTGTRRINPATGQPWTPAELKAKYSDVDFDKEAEQAERVRLKDLAKQEILKDKIKASLDDPRDTARDLAKSLISKGDLGIDFKQSQSSPTVSPAPGPSQGQPPGFTAANLARQPGMAQYMQNKSPTSKTSPNFAQAPGGYTSTTMKVNPAKTTTVAPTATTTANADVYQALVKLGYLPKAAAAAVKNLPPNISTSDALRQVLSGRSMNTP